MSFTEACINDTASIDLGYNLSGELEANIVIGPDGTLEVDGGVQVRFGAAGGLEIDGNGLAVNLQGDGLAVNASGIQKVNQLAVVGWSPGASDDTITHDFPIARGSSTATSAATVNVTLNGNASGSYVMFRNYTSGVLQTTFSEFEPSDLADEVGIQLQSNYDNGGWVVDDRAVCRLFRQSCAFKLYQTRPAILHSGIAHSMQSRLVITGGIASGTAIQGKLYQTFCRGMQVEW